MIMIQKQKMIKQLYKTNSATWAAARGEPTSILTKKSVFHTSFQPRTFREMRGENN